MVAGDGGGGDVLAQTIGKEHPQVARNKRALILWELPHLGSGNYIEMYVNPQNITTASSKLINQTLTKGGYMIQYWGEQLDKITINGHTSDSGIEGLNVLRDIYRSEQLALLAQAKLATTNKLTRRQSLAQLASSVVMWYQGQGYRGFFTDFSNNEKATDYLIDYTINFSVVDIIGRPRKNYYPWSRSPWSTSNTPTNSQSPSGAYGTNVKVGQLSIPSIQRFETVEVDSQNVQGGTASPTNTIANIGTTFGGAIPVTAKQDQITVVVPFSNLLADTKVDRVAPNVAEKWVKDNDIAFDRYSEGTTSIKKDSLRILRNSNDKR